MTLRAVLFDYGHTLVDFHRTEEALHDAYTRIRELVIETVGEETTPATERLVADLARAVDDVVQTSYRERRLEELDLLAVFDGILGGLGLGLPRDVVRRMVALDHLAYRSCITLPDETVAVLDDLHGRGLKVGFVSNAHFLPDLLREDLEVIGLAPHLDGGAFSSEVGTRKPDPAIFLHVLDELGVDPEDAVHVGDRVGDDVSGALRTGLRGGVLTRQWRREDPGGDEAAVIDHLAELPQALDRLGWLP